MRKTPDSTPMKAEEFFGPLGVETRPTRRRARMRRLPGLLLGFLLTSSLLGLLLLAPIAMLGAGGAVGAAPVVQYWKELPDTLPEVAIAERNIIYDKNGAVIAQSWSENRVPLEKLSEVSPLAVQALVDTEDKRFYQTKGFDPQGTLRAAVSGSGGGSGITQQLVKNLLFYNMLGKESKDKAVERSYLRKLRELKLAINYDKNHSKDEILLSYFNTVALGAPNIYGIEASSQYFFGKKAKDLTLAEASALVGTAQNPVIFNMSDPEKEEKWRGRQKAVLERMQAEGHITAQEAKAAYATKLKLLKKSTSSGCSASKYPFYCKYVMDYMATNPRLGESEEERSALLAKGGLHIYTYMDPKMMDTINAYMQKNWGNKNRIIAPTAVVQPGTGGVVAFGANRAWGAGKGKTEIVLPNVPSAEGSAYKLFTLAAALNNGYHEGDLTFSSEGCPLRPGPNYDAPPGGFKNSNSCKLQGGNLSYKQATAYSSNTWYVTLEKRVGVAKVKEFSKKVGLAAPDAITDRSLSYTLGVVGNSPIRVAAAYATFANKGVYCPATPIRSVTFSDGTEPPVPDSYDPALGTCRSVMSPAAASVVLKALRANVSGEVPKAFGLRANVKGHDNGGKSGTNEGFNSAWAHLTAQYSLYTNVHDMDKTSRGVDGAIFKGEYTTWRDNTAETTGSDLMRTIHRSLKNKALDFNNQDYEVKPTYVDVSDFFVVPSVVGLKPEAAVGVFEGLGMKVHVAKERKATPRGYSTEVIVDQSIKAGTQLVKGTKKEIILYQGS